MFSFLGAIVHKMPISKTSRIPKTIWGIIAAISIAVLGFILLPSVWFWICWEVVAAVLVAFGCFGEWWLFKTPAAPGDEGHHRNNELRFILVVAIGVTMELCGLTHTIPEAMRLERDVQQLESTNLVLRSNLAAVVLKIQPRTITDMQRQQFIQFLSDAPKCPVRIHCGNVKNETKNYANKIREMLDAAGYGATNGVLFDLENRIRTTGFEGVSVECVVTNLPEPGPPKDRVRFEISGVAPFETGDFDPESFKRLKKGFVEIGIWAQGDSLPLIEAFPKEMQQKLTNWPTPVIPMVPGEISIILNDRDF